MSKPTLQIVQPGMFSTIQDRGRYGYQRFGMPTAGAMDTFALRSANALLANEDNAACIEATVLGPRIQFLADTRIAVTGADVSPRVDGEAIPMWQAIAVAEGSRLEFRSPKDGMRAYLAVAGGINVPQVMGSRATYIKASIGGLEGRQLRAGDVLHAFGDDPAIPKRDCAFPADAIPKYGSAHRLRVALGPQHESFTKTGIDTFLNSTYAVSINSDRMGYRLEGVAIEHTVGPDIISDGIALGAIQVPGDGQPIILLADRGTTGGYTKIATVVSADLSKVAQAMPGHTITFEAVSVEEAQESYFEREALLGAVRSAAVAAPRLAVVMDGAVSDILGDDGMPLTLPVGGDASTNAQSGTARVDGARFDFDITVRRLDD